MSFIVKLIARLAVGLVWMCLVGLTTAAAEPNEEIEALLSYVKGLDGAVFIRNGREHSAIAAEAHLRMKWEKQAKQIATAEDFISLCASKSFVSGKRYQIRLKDGASKYADELLLEQLAIIRKAGRTSPVARRGPRLISSPHPRRTLA